MAIHCPYCQHGFTIKVDKPGRFGTRCPRCSKTFAVTVPEGPDPKVAVAPLNSELASGAGAETVGPSSVGRMSAEFASNPGSSPVAPREKEPRPVVSPTQPDAFAGPSPTGLAAMQAGPADPSGATTDFDSADVRTMQLDGPPHAGEIPSRLGGYQIVKLLGQGGMGAVYLARQLSLDRDVALKVMKPRWASDPTFVSRFTREAFAAAQLVHHNVVQIHDFGEDHGTQYFSMEFVDGQTLSDLVRRDTKLDAEVAAGYLLQAARGLKFAHDQHMIHRDIKPDNLMLNAQGIVKVADLGLVKTAGGAVAFEPSPGSPGVEAGVATAGPPGQITRADIAMGTPAYMAPEQARDAAHVDARADIYSLGCTLYVMVTGRPPFQGKTVLEILSKHATEPIVPPDAIVKRVPKALSEIIQKMVAKKPEDRYNDLGEVIKALEGFLGISSAGPFTPPESQADALEASVQEFHDVGLARLRPKLVLGALAACALLTLIFLVRGHALMAGGMIWLALLTLLTGFLLQGHFHKSHQYLKARELVLGAGPGDWLMAAIGLGLFVTTLAVLHLLWVWLTLSVVGVGLAVALYYLVDLPIIVARDVPLDRIEGMLKEFRLRGQEEDAIRQFVCKFGGDRWEEFFEALFGYEAKLAARERWGRGTRGRPRPRYAAWRDPIVSWIEAKLWARKETRERKLLQKIEENSLVAQGVNLVTARRKAARSADAMVTVAGELRQSAAERATLAAGPDARTVRKAMMEAAERPDRVLTSTWSDSREKRSSLLPRLDFVLGPRPRFIAGGLLLAGCLAWMDQNELISGRQISENVRTAIEKKDRDRALKDARELGSRLVSNVQSVVGSKRQTRPLRLAMLPPSVTDLFHDFGPGVAGLILLISSLYRGIKISLFAVPGAVLALLGPRLGLPSIGPVDAPLAGIASGVTLLVLGLLFGESRH